MKTLKVATLLKAYWKHIIMIMLILGFVVSNILSFGGSDFVFTLNNFVTIGLITGIAYLSMRYWHGLPVKTNHRLIFFCLAVSYSLWAIAEVWWGVGSFIGAEVPYPSGQTCFGLWDISRCILHSGCAFVPYQSLPAGNKK